MICPCGSSIAYTECCGLFHSGEEKPVTAVALMRSRFTAYALHKANYLLNTWDATLRPTSIDFSDDNINWLRLEIVNTKKGGAPDSKGTVEFKAYYSQQGEECVMHEVSKFIKHEGRWFYLDGLVKSNGKEQLRPGMNSPCPCGSGKKFKRCCGK